MNESHGPQIFAREKSARNICAAAHCCREFIVYDLQKIFVVKMSHLYALILRTFLIFAPLHDNKSVRENCAAPITRFLWAIYTQKKFP